MLVAIEQAGRLVASYVDIRPAVVIEIGDDHAKAITAAGREDAGLRRDVGKRAVAVVVIERIVGHGQPLRAAYDHDSFPLAVLAASGLWCLTQIEVDIVRDEDIQVAVAIVVDKRTARSPARAGDRQAGGPGDIREFSATHVPVEAVVAVVRDQKVRMTVVIEIAHAGGLRPTGTRQSGLLTDFGKVTFAIVAVEQRTGRRSVGVERGSIRNEDVVSTVAVVVEDRGSGAGAFENVVLLVLPAEGGREWSAPPGLQYR